MDRALQFIVSILILLSIIAFPRSSFASSDEDEELDLDLEDLDLDLEDLSPAAASAGSASTVGQAQKQRALIDLTDQTLDRVIGSYEHVLLLGYAPWCTRSSALMPDFAAAAVTLRGSGSSVLLAKLDGVGNPRSAARYGIKGFPTLLFFRNGTEESYTGGHTRDEIVIWIKKRTGSPATTVSSKTEAEQISQKNATFVVGFFERFEGTEYDGFIAAAKAEEGTEFIQVDNEDVAKTLTSGMQNVAPSISILKSEPEFFVPFENNFDKDSILWFVEVNKQPLITKLSQQNYGRIYSSPVKLQVTLFADAAKSELLKPLFQDVAKQFKGQILFLLMDTVNEELSRPILTVYGLEPAEPIVTAFDNGNGDKYHLEAELTADNLKEFCVQLLSGGLKLHHKSEPIPTKMQGDVQIVVGKTFESIVLDNSKDVFLEVYTPWCVMCDKVNKVIEKLGKTFREVSSLVIAKINADLNEHPLLQANEYPSLLFYPAGQKKSPILAPKKWTVKELVQFIHDHASNPIPIQGHSDKDEL